MKTIAIMLVIFAVTCSGCCTHQNIYSDKGKKYRFILTTKIKNFKPLNSHESAQIDEGGKIYYIAKLFDLKPNAIHKYRCRIIDQAGNIVTNINNEFIPKASYYIQKCGTTPNPHTDESGIWKFEGYINEKLVVNESRTITLRKK